MRVPNGWEAIKVEKKRSNRTIKVTRWAKKSVKAKAKKSK